jgi:hypothetical protein
MFALDTTKFGNKNAATIQASSIPDPDPQVCGPSGSVNQKFDPDPSIIKQK